MTRRTRLMEPARMVMLRRAGVTVAEIAEQAGISVQRVSVLLKKHMSAEERAQLAYACRSVANQTRGG